MIHRSSLAKTRNYCALSSVISRLSGRCVVTSSCDTCSCVVVVSCLCVQTLPGLEAAAGMLLSSSAVCLSLQSNRERMDDVLSSDLEPGFDNVDVAHFNALLKPCHTSSPQHSAPSSVTSLQADKNTNTVTPVTAVRYTEPVLVGLLRLR